ncbi:MAG: MBOAT family protein [Ruminococcaceae bacterium]|nr:MBOAT family protein [Oscillospiraceae bacterium]
MLFNSYIFVLFFLPAVILIYFGLNRIRQTKAAMLFLLLMSLWFYGYFNTSYLIIILGSIAVNYSSYLLMKRSKAGVKKAVAATAVLLNVGALFYFKYYDFFVENINSLFGSDFVLRNILLPLGISFFTFQQLSFVIDAYKNEIPDYNIIDYACFVTYFPQLVAGPIVTHDELVPQFADASKKQFNWENFTKGLYAFVLGLAKKVLIADMLGNVVNYGYSSIGSLDSVGAVIVMLSYTVQIYFDFSGYSDMAIGMGKMMNIELPINFNSPYRATTINDFWDRWHITLTRFFTRYIYIPMGGNRKGSARTYLNIMLVYLVSGIWHGANWTFIFWGICHGIFCVASRMSKGFINKLPKALNWLITFIFVNVMWVFFRAESMSDAFLLLERVFTGGFGGIDYALTDNIMSAEWSFLASQIAIVSKARFVILLGYIFVPLAGAVFCKTVSQRMNDMKPNVVNMLVTVLLLVLCILSFSGVSTFLYFNF